VTSKLRRICENLGWTIEIEEYANGTYYRIAQYSPAGEDFSFSVDATDDFVQSVKEYAADFNPDEHIEMWIEARKNGTAGVPSARELVHDAEDLDTMLQELAAALWRAEYLSTT
jgi:hypothetical protein